MCAGSRGGSRLQSLPVIQPLVPWPMCQCENLLHCFMTVAIGWHRRYACENVELLRSRVNEVDRGIRRQLEAHEVGKLLTSIIGIGVQTAAWLIGELGDRARFRDRGALASYVGVAPRLRQSGKRKTSRVPGIPLGNARLRHALWMPRTIAVRFNPWLRAYHQRLLGAGKRPKVALVACMRKLLTAVLSVARSCRSFVPLASNESAALATTWLVCLVEDRRSKCLYQSVLKSACAFFDPG
jgi:Transposase IS116/IS110/IS902 family